MLRKMILKERSGRGQLTFPVTPPGFTVSDGITMQTIHIHEVGDVNLAGKPSRGSIKLEVMFPSIDYSFAATDSQPYEYIEKLNRWCSGRKILQYIVTGTQINKTVLLEGVEYGEQDGTNDLYATVTMREYVELEAAETVRPKGTSKPRTGGSSAISTDFPWAVKKGDCMSSIALARYGNGGKAYYEALAAHNNRSAYAYIYVGETIMCPPKEVLGLK